MVSDHTPLPAHGGDVTDSTTPEPSRRGRLDDHTPGPCGCRAVGWWEPLGTSEAMVSNVRYCPLHAAAPDLLAALVTIARQYLPGEIAGDVARAAIAQAKDVGVGGQRSYPDADVLDRPDPNSPLAQAKGTADA